MESHHLDPFLRKHSRFYLHAARTHALEHITGSPELVAAVEVGYSEFRGAFAESPFSGWLGDREAVALYQEWASADFEGGTSLSTRGATEDLNLLLDEGKWTNDLLSDSVDLTQTIAVPESPDPASLLLVGINVEILERKRGHLTNAFLLNVSDEMRATYEGVVDKLIVRKQAPLAPIEWSRRALFGINTAVFLANVLFKAALAEIANLALFSLEDGTIRPRGPFAGEQPDRLGADYFREEFLQGHLDRIAAVEASFHAVIAALADRFSPDYWQESGELRDLALLVVRLWDDQGLLGRIPYADLYLLCHRKGPFFQKVESALAEARRQVENLLKIIRLAKLVPLHGQMVEETLFPPMDELFLQSGSSREGFAICAHMIEEKQKAFAALMKSLQEEIARLGADCGGILDPALEELIHLLPPPGILSEALLRDLVHLGRKLGPHYRPLAKRFEEAKRQYRYLEKLHAFEEGRLAECLAALGKKEFEKAAAAYEPVAELAWKFPDLNYAAVEGPLEDWSRLVESHRSYRESFAAMERDLAGNPPSEQRATLLDAVAQWEAFLSSQRASIEDEPENDYRSAVSSFLGEIEPRLAHVRKQLS